VITLDFDSSVSGDQFVLTAAGHGTDVTLASAAGATLAGLSHDVMNFVSDYHHELTDGRIVPVHGLESSLMPTVNAAASDHTSYGFSSPTFIEHGVVHAAVGVCKA
jgi:hypothetical protein